MKKRYHIPIEIDVAAGVPARGMVTVGGVPYRITAVPLTAGQQPPPGQHPPFRRPPRNPQSSVEGDPTFGWEGEPTISLGPRGAGCPVCGK